jgi:hypothetical protein
MCVLTNTPSTPPAPWLTSLTSLTRRTIGPLAPGASEIFAMSGNPIDAFDKPFLSLEVAVIEFDPKYMQSNKFQKDGTVVSDTNIF